MTIYDIACGHGLLGTLFAYRFPKAQVICVDLVLSDSYVGYGKVFEQFG